MKSQKLMTVAALVLTGWLAAVSPAYAKARYALSGAVVSGTIASNTTWSVLGSPYHVTGDVVIPLGVTLTVDPGVTVEVDSGRSIFVNGSLEGNGTLALPVAFTSAAASPAPGDWRGIATGTGGRTSLANTRVAFAGYGGSGGVDCSACAGLSLSNSSVDHNLAHGINALSPGSFSLQNSSVRSNGGLGLDLITPTGTPVLVGNSFTGNGSAAGVVQASSLGSVNDNSGSGNSPDVLQLAGAFADSGGPYNLDNSLSLGVPADGSLLVPTGVTVTVAGGQTFEMSARSALNVNGSLEGNGTLAAPVVFTSVAGSPAPGDWRGIRTGTGGRTSLANAKIAYAGYGGSGGVDCSGCAGLSLSNSSVDHNLANGVNGLSPGSFSLQDSSLAANGGLGFFLDGAVGTPVLDDNNFSSNGAAAGLVHASSIGSVTGNTGSGNSPDVLQLSGGFAVSGGPYNLDNSLSLGVPADGSLTIPAGVTVAAGGGQTFRMGARSALNVNGSLEGNGTLALPVVFTSAAGSPAAGDWRGIATGTGGRTSLANAKVAYAGYTGFGAVDCSNCAALSLSNSSVDHNWSDGVRALNPGSASITYTVLRDNGGIGVNVNGSLTARNDDFVGNAVGLFVGSGATVLDSSIVRGNGTGVGRSAGSVTISYSIISANTTDFDGVANPIGAQGNFATDPAFVNEAARDLGLRAGSAAIDTGNPAFRDPDMSALDRGAFPFGAAQVVVAVTGGTVAAGTPITLPISVSGTGAANLKLAVSVTGTNSAVGTPTTDAAGHASFSYTPTAAGIDTVTVAADGNGNGTIDAGEATGSALVAVSGANHAPVSDPGGPYTATAGTPSVVLDGSGSSDPDGDAITYAWDLNNDGSFSDSSAQKPSFSVGSAPPGTVFSVCLRVRDTGGLLDTKCTTVTVLVNHAPFSDPGGPYSASPGATIVLDGSNSHDPDGDPITYAWDLDNDGLFSDSSAQKPTFTVSSIPGTVYSVCLRVRDAGGLLDTKCSTVTVVSTNRPPVANAGPDQQVAEGDLVTLDGSASSDPDGDALAYSWSQIGGPAVALSSTSAAKPTFTAPDDGAYTFRAVVSDGHATASDDVTVNVANVVPVVQITGPASGTLSRVGDPVTFTGSFTDRGRVDTHTARWSFDALTAAGVVVESNGSGSVSAAYTFSAAGVYQVKLDVTDDDGGLGSATTVAGSDAYVVVYDPSAGFVTGGGWINSPAGAYRAQPSLAGRASFGFVSKYKKGATTPTGETEFDFSVASFRFHSDTYQWLVVAGAKAQYKGTGSVNGTSGYGFLLTVTDGDLAGGGGVDKFRIKIWNLAGGNTVYDNVGGSDDIDNANPQAIAGGSIVIHS
jgi:PKD repeat protein